MGILRTLFSGFKFPKINLAQYDNIRQEVEGSQVTIPETKTSVIPTQVQYSIEKEVLYTTSIQTPSHGTPGPFTDEYDLINPTTGNFKLKRLSMYLMPITCYSGRANFRLDFRISRLAFGDVDVFNKVICATMTPRVNTVNQSFNETLECKELNVDFEDLIIPKGYRLYANHRLTDYGVGTGTSEIRVIISGFYI